MRIKPEETWLISCEESAIVRDAMIRYGAKAISCDLKPTRRHGPHIQGDVLKILDDGWFGLIAFPVCTYLTISRNAWYKPEYEDRFPDQFKQREEAIEFFMAHANADIEKIAIENPIGIMSTIWRKPDQIIQPYQFGHLVSKRTCLWLKNLPTLRATDVVKPEYITFKSGKRMDKWFARTIELPPEERTRVRSQTFEKIADAMAKEWTSKEKRGLLW